MKPELDWDDFVKSSSAKASRPSWAEFTERLASELAGLDGGMVLIVHHADQDAYYVQAHRDPWRIRGETVGNEVLDAPLRFPEEAEKRLAGAGWHPPGPNWWFEVPATAPVAEFRRLACMMVTALRDVQRAREPAELRYEAFRGTTGIELTGLGVTLAKPSEVSECRPARRLPCDDSTAAGPLTDAAMGTATDEPIAPAVMQKVVPHPLVVHYLDGGYDRVAGYVHQARDVADLNTPERLVRGLGLTYEGSPFSVDDEAIHVIRWPVLKAALFKTPFGGIDEASMRSARDGWVIERPPFLGTGYAPGDGPPIPEFKIVSQRLPHGAQLFRIERSGEAAQVASFDADGRRWAKGS